MDAPRIAPGVTQVMNQNLMVVADVDPEQFPAGLEVMLFKPNNVTPLAGITIPRGCILLAVPPSPVAEHMRQQIRQSMAAQQRRAGPGEVKAPGL